MLTGLNQPLAMLPYNYAAFLGSTGVISCSVHGDRGHGAKILPGQLDKVTAAETPYNPEAQWGLAPISAATACINNPNSNAHSSSTTGFGKQLKSLFQRITKKPNTASKSTIVCLSKDATAKATEQELAVISTNRGTRTIHVLCTTEGMAGAVKPHNRAETASNNSTTRRAAAPRIPLAYQLRSLGPLAGFVPC